MKPRLMLSSALATLLAVVGCADTRFAEVRRVTLTESTGNCVGDPRTPLCAIETFYACFVRRDSSLCEKVGQPGYRFGDERPGFVATHKHYVLLRERTIREVPASLVWRMPPGWQPDWYKPGFVDVRALTLVCYSYGRCDRRWEDESIIVKPIDGSWHVTSALTGDSEEGEDEPPEDEDEIRKQE